MTYPVIEITKDTTDQELFNAVVTHMLGMDGPCKDERGNCAYRGPGGTACAVGALLSDSVLELYFGAIGELFTQYTRSVYDAYECEADKIPELERLMESEYLMTDLQHVHDKDASWGKGGLNSVGVERLMGLALAHLSSVPKALLDKREELKA